MLTGEYPQKQGLYDPAFEKGSCGVGFIANASGIQSHNIVESGLEILKNMSHRGATGADPETGDGAGIMLQIPHEFFKTYFKQIDMVLPERGAYAVGMVFLPMAPNDRYFCEGVFERILKEENLEFLTWREVPVNDKACGMAAQSTRPIVQQIFIRNNETNILTFKRKLYIARKRIEKEIERNKTINASAFFICSLSTETIVYKGQFLAHQIENFYFELNNKDITSAFAIVHQRYSTNTFPSWKLAHPYRYVSHNGEINTIRGNRKWMQAREGMMSSHVFKESLKDILPIIKEGGSDSFSFDNVLEFMILSGLEITKAFKILMPEAWRYDHVMSHELKAFYEYYEGLIEAWDGPATMVFSDGDHVGVSLDRNGLRPARYIITTDDQVIMASEAGVLDVPAERVLKRGKLGPGSILMVDMKYQRILFDKEIKHDLSHQHPYQSWIYNNKIDLKSVPVKKSSYFMDEESLIEMQKIFSYSEEELKRVLAPMASKSKEAVTSMGNDVPLALLSDQPQLMFNYFRQVFAQVTNPPIDPLREKKVMSLNQYIGRSGDFLENFNMARKNPFIELEQPILYPEKMDYIRHIKIDTLKSVTIPTIFEVDKSVENFKNALETLIERVESSVRKGYRIIILSDRDADRYRAAIPSILAISAVHNDLIKKQLRTKVDLIVETGEARDAFHMALLIGYGATAVYPYLAFESIQSLVKEKLYVKVRDPQEASMNYVRALGYGLRKITSKMGISTLRSFNGAQIFEILGLNQNIVDTYFNGTPNKLSGIDFSIIVEEIRLRHEKAFDIKVSEQKLEIGSRLHWRKGDTAHLMTPDTIAKLQHSCRTNDYRLFKEFSGLVNNQSKHLKTIRGLLKFKTCQSIPIEEVESIEAITKHFATGAMSFGSLSKEVHETLAIAMNRMGGKSNSGEGGEDEARYKSLDNGDSKRSAIKQVAAARFGVDTHYLVEAEELQIKVAQGAKPGEGGHLPGSKVTKEIAKVRHSIPGIDLISPPPHHDIYSIEDLEQLIFDLKNVNPSARVSVKLVSEAGVGTVAAGVAKGCADMVLISGHDGGTGAAPITSVKTAGVPWEIGLSETHQTLLLNNLRSRIAVQVDGQLRTGRDVAIGALLGAEEFAFATAPLIVSGCIMMRQCHNNTCPVGVATQDPELRKQFKGKPEHIINYFSFIAMEVREIMAALGIRRLKDMVGRVDLLEMSSERSWKTRNLDLSSILYKPELPSRFSTYQTTYQDSPIEDILDLQFLKASEETMMTQEPIELSYKISNTNRSTGTFLSGRIASRFGKKGLPDDTININLEGSSGQSFGAFLIKGITMSLTGDANDYVGKGLSGGKIIVKTNETFRLESYKNMIAGNTLLYGATSGLAYFSGLVGERFAVRNSGAIAVAEGVGDHGCEYMTGGKVIILGKTGRNFAAGMSGGIAYVLDEDMMLHKRVNPELVSIEKLSGDELDDLKNIIEDFVQKTGSLKGQLVLDKWACMSSKFQRVISDQYKKVIKVSKEMVG